MAPCHDGEPLLRGTRVFLLSLSLSPFFFLGGGGGGGVRMSGARRATTRSPKAVHVARVPRPRKGFSPSVRTFTAVVNAHAKAGDLCGALKAMHAMQAFGVKADTMAYSTLLSVCARKGNIKCAQTVFALMRKQKIRPNIVSYTSLARAFAKNGMWYEVEILGETLEREGLCINDFFLYALLLAYSTAKPKQMARAETTFLRVVQTQHIEINKHILSGLARAVGCSRAKDLVSMTERCQCQQRNS